MRALLLLVALLLTLFGLTLWKGISKEALPAVEPAESTLFLGLDIIKQTDLVPQKETSLHPVAESPSSAAPSSTRPVTSTPLSPKTSLQNLQPLTYTVKSGDSFYRILQRHYGSADDALLNAVADANQVSDPSALSVGQTLILPVLPGQRPPSRP